MFIFITFSCPSNNRARRYVRRVFATYSSVLGRILSLVSCVPFSFILKHLLASHENDNVAEKRGTKEARKMPLWHRCHSVEKLVWHMGAQV